MKQADLIDKIAKDNHLTKVQAKGALESVIDAIQTTLKKEGRMAITGFGTFTVGRRAARDGQNPLTKEKIKIPASNTTKFKAAPALKEAVAKFKVPKN